MKIDLFDGKWHGLSIRRYKRDDKIIDEIYDIDNGIKQSWVNGVEVID